MLRVENPTGRKKNATGKKHLYRKNRFCAGSGRLGRGTRKHLAVPVSDGEILGGLFFLLVFFAALTSSISLMETVVSILQDRFGWKRMTSCLAVLAGSVLLGIPSLLGNGLWSRIRILGFTFLDFFDFISNSLLMPIVAFLTCLFAKAGCARFGG